ncbi:MAG: hypothetical protein WC867_07095 [Candidatus Pacearchaeota archaeon]|jgi:hypothetical protein
MNIIKHLNKFSIVLLAFILALQLVSASHYITGYVHDSLDSLESANDKQVILWNPIIGMQENISDIIGINGNSESSNTFMFDCELLNNSCKIGDIFKVKTLNDGDNYFSEEESVIISGAGYDITPDLILNSPPNITLNFPLEQGNESRTVRFNCSIFDLDSNLHNVSLYGNWTGTWHLNETIETLGGATSVLFEKNLSEGEYSWNCLSYDNLSISGFNYKNNTFRVDTTSPVISQISVNSTYGCGNSYINVNCSAIDSYVGIDSVIIQALKPSGSAFYPANILIPGVYSTEILLDEGGNWSFICIANDSSSNIANLSSNIIRVYSLTENEIYVNYSKIYFGNEKPIETEEVIINATIENRGCSNLNNFLVGFFNGEPTLGNQIGNNLTISIPGFSSQIVNISWSALIGLTNIFIFADLNDSIIEINNNNNIANKTIIVGSWQTFYGNVTLDKILADSLFFNFSSWYNESEPMGNIFVADKESNINWAALYPIGRNISGDLKNDDFSNIDNIFNTAEFNDSVEKLYSTFGNSKFSDSFFIHHRNLTNVPILNSTNSSNFITGILWDSAKDSGNGEFDVIDKEDIVFVTKINKASPGGYGIYDYEITIPVRLREFNSLDSSEIYFYYELE